MIIRDHESRAQVEVEGKPRTLTFVWPCGDNYEVKRRALERLLDVIESTGVPAGIRIGGVADNGACRMTTWGLGSNPPWETLSVFRSSRTQVKATHGEFGDGYDVARFTIRDLRRALAL